MNVRGAPDNATIGGRLKAERLRLGFSQPALAAVAGVAKNTAVNWENDVSSPTANTLAAFAEAGANVLFIVTGHHVQSQTSTALPLAGLTVRQALAMLDRVDRHRLLLDLLAAELRA